MQSDKTCYWLSNISGISQQSKAEATILSLNTELTYCHFSNMFQCYTGFRYANLYFIKSITLSTCYLI